MTARKHKAKSPLVELLAAKKGVLTNLMREALQTVLESGVTERRANARNYARVTGQATTAGSWSLPHRQAGAGGAQGPPRHRPAADPTGQAHPERRHRILQRAASR